MTTPAAPSPPPAGWRGMLRTRRGSLLQVIVLAAVMFLLPSGFIWSPAVVALIALGLMWLTGDSWTTLGFRKPEVSAGRWLTEGLVTGVLAQLVVTGMVLPAVGGARNAASRQGDLSYLLTGLMVYGFIHALAKGLALRAFLLHRLQNVFAADGIGLAAAVVAASLLFGASSWQLGFTGAALAALAGAVFNLLFYWSRRNIWPTLLAHSAYNVTLFVLIYFGRA